jgi:hypothetical protein
LPGLWWNWKQFELTAAADDIGQMLQGIGAELRRAGYTAVAVAEDVHGFKENFMVAVLYLEISDRNLLAGDRRDRRARKRDPAGSGASDRQGLILLVARDAPLARL